MQKKIRRVILESPYKGKSSDPEIARLETIRNIEYARACLRDCALRDESAYASHLLLTQDGVLDDNIPEERDLGIRLGFAWREAADMSVFYIDLGVSGGMKLGMEDAKASHRPTEERRLPEGEWKAIEDRHAERLWLLETSRKT